MKTLLKCCLLILVFCFPVLAETRVDEIKKSGELRVAVRGDRGRFSWKNSSGKISGLEIDLARRIAAKLGVSVTFLEVPWEDIRKTVVGGENTYGNAAFESYDLILSGIVNDPDWAGHVAFSDPYFSKSGGRFLVRQDSRKETLEDMRTGRIGILEGSWFDDVLVNKKFRNAQINRYTNYNELLEAVLNRQIDGALEDRVQLFWLTRGNFEFRGLQELACEYSFSAAYPKGEIEFGEVINEVIAKNKNKLYDRWFKKQKKEEPTDIVIRISCGEGTCKVTIKNVPANIRKNKEKLDAFISKTTKQIYQVLYPEPEVTEE